MTTKKIKPWRLAIAACGLSMLLASGAASAHGVWVAQRAGEWALVLGEGALDEAYDPKQVHEVKAFTASGGASTVRLLPRERNVVLEPAADAAVLSVAVEDGFWSQGADGKWVSGSRLKVPDARRAGYYMKYGTTLLNPVRMPLQPLGMDLEIVPLVDPSTLRRGQSLPLRVFSKGQPVAGVAVIADFIGHTAGPRVKTDKAGRATVVVGSSGLNVVAVSLNRPRSDRREADEDGLEATLAFTLPRAGD
jgi:nickel transport protein